MTEAVEHAPDTQADARHARMRHGFVNLEVALHDGADAAAAGRALVARTLATPPERLGR